jgi:predicted alpha/beta hydrolase family esterase
MSLSTLLQQVFAGVRYRGPRKPIKKQGLVLYSKKDDLVDPSCSIAIAKHLSAQIIAHENAGHDLILDDPMWVVARMKDFFEGMGEP